MQTSKITEFDPIIYLNTEEVIGEYLRLALASDDTDLLRSAFSDAAKTQILALSSQLRP
jgi:DNA-binding phage protein